MIEANDINQKAEVKLGISEAKRKFGNRIKVFLFARGASIVISWYCLATS